MCSACSSRARRNSRSPAPPANLIGPQLSADTGDRSSVDMPIASLPPRDKALAGSKLAQPQHETPCLRSVSVTRTCGEKRVSRHWDESYGQDTALAPPAARLRNFAVSIRPCSPCGAIGNCASVAVCLSISPPPYANDGGARTRQVWGSLNRPLCRPVFTQ